jgi:2-oxo-4-hydroxy-4-carboxy-5-ureidoimidazoline decarboxylase
METSMTLDDLNDLSEMDARRAFLRCCTSEHWADEMARHRPFTSQDALFEHAESLWWDLSADHWLQAFAGHPKIGDIDSLRKKYAGSRAWSEGEQKGVESAAEEVLKRLARMNDTYEEKFGYIFIVCATGKSAAEMLEILESRLPNPPDRELKIAAAEQARITAIRLEKLLADR